LSEETSHVKKPDPRETLPERFGQLALECLNIGLKLENEILSQIHFDGDCTPEKHQAAMINFCSAIEHSAKAILAKECPPALFLSNNRKSLSIYSLRKFLAPEFQESDLNYVLLNHHVLGFGETLHEAQGCRDDLRYPVSVAILEEARNQAIHSLVPDQGRLSELVAISALYMVDFITDKSIANLSFQMTESDRNRLDEFETARAEAQINAHNKLKDIRKKPLAYVDPDKFLNTKTDAQKIHALCPLCGCRAQFIVDPSEAGFGAKTIVMLSEETSGLKIFNPKYFSCPGCGLSLEGEEARASSLIFRFDPDR